jgi:hypothetical protein
MKNPKTAPCEESSSPMAVGCCRDNFDNIPCHCSYRSMSSRDELIRNRRLSEPSKIPRIRGLENLHGHHHQHQHRGIGGCVQDEFDFLFAASPKHDCLSSHHQAAIRKAPISAMKKHRPVAKRAQRPVLSKTISSPQQSKVSFNDNSNAQVERCDSASQARHNTSGNASGSGFNNNSSGVSSNTNSKRVYKRGVAWVVT